MFENKIKEKQIFCRALIVRVIMLVIIFIFSGYMADGFIGSDTYYDDYRYEAGGEYYSENAKSIIDIGAFVSAYASVGDWVGYHFLESPIDASPLWYWIVCIIMYITKSKWAVRMVNVIFSSLAILYVYRFTKIIYGESIAERTCKLLTFLPYPLIFSCFSYKDQLIMLCTFFLLWVATRYRYYEIMNVKTVLGIATASIILLFTRGGLTAILLVLCVLIMFVKNFSLKISKRKLIIGALFIIVALVIFGQSFNTIIFKVEYYFARHENTLGGTSISFLTVNGLTEIYKLPLTYIFSVLMPIGMFGEINSWYSIVANANVIMTFIAVGATLYIFRKKEDKIVFWGCLFFYLISIITSINIFRHYYSLIPFNLVAFSAAWEDRSNSHSMKLLILIGGLLLSLLLILYYGILR